MGNCLRSSKFENHSNPSNVTSITGTPSNLTRLFSERCCNESLPPPRSESEILSSPNMKVFTLEELSNATRNFWPDLLLGQGGFGTVFKGFIGEPGTGCMAVAIKKFTSGRSQGHDYDHKEWLTEINYLGQLRHPNLVKLIGYCSEGDNRLLVYEFMPRGSLDHHLFPQGAQPLSWDIRLRIAIGAAKGISYLHDAESQVLYIDYKSSNILLDSGFNCKLSDFGLAIAIPTGDNTHESPCIAGTYSYMAPEYIKTGLLSAKADVYSFGVVLLELLSGQRVFCIQSEVEIKSNLEPADIGKNLLVWLNHLDNKGKLLRIMDKKLEAQYPKKGARAVAKLALRCISAEPTLRPRMSEVLEVLEQLLIDH